MTDIEDFLRERAKKELAEYEKAHAYFLASAFLFMLATALVAALLFAWIAECP